MSASLQRNQTPLPAWHLAQPADMIAALGELSAQGWRGGVACDETGAVWRLEINADNPTRQIVAELGGWLVDDLGLRLLTAQECADNYEEITE